MTLTMYGHVAILVNGVISIPAPLRYMQLRGRETPTHRWLAQY